MRVRVNSFAPNCSRSPHVRGNRRRYRRDVHNSGTQSRQLRPLRLHHAGSLAHARAELAARQHDLVILDLMLPDGDGAELLPELGAAQPPVPVIIFSATDLALPESRVVLRRLVKSRSDAHQLAALISDNLRRWPAGPAHDKEVS